MTEAKRTFLKIKKVWAIVIGIPAAISTFWGAYLIYDHLNTPDISGEWYITLTVESSTYKAYIGDVIGIKAYFTQSEKSIRGYGEKWDYRGKPLDYKQHRKLEFDGGLDGGLFTANYVLHGELRETTGMLKVSVVEGGDKMIGTFTGTAADTKGTVTGEKRK